MPHAQLHLLQTQALPPIALSAGCLLNQTWKALVLSFTPMFNDNAATHAPPICAHYHNSGHMQQTYMTIMAQYSPKFFEPEPSR